MEHQATKGRKPGDCGGGSDRISQLPEPILHHILCFLSHKKAVQTSVLSKPWRHIGPTRPVIELRGACEYHVVGHVSRFCENCFNGNKEAFINVLENTFQRYHDRNIFMHELRLKISKDNSQSISVLEKWIPMLFNPDKPAVSTFHLSFDDYPFHVNYPYTNLPSVVLKVDSLRELHLTRCGLDEINSIDKFLLKNLQNLSLSSVYISDEALEKVLSGCPLVKRLVMHHCEGFKTINIGNKNPYLNYFEISSTFGNKNPYLKYFGISSPFGETNETSIEIDAPTLESISIMGWWKWHLNHNNYFPRLKSLSLSQLKLPTDSFHYFSRNFPCLEHLSLDDCGFEEINLSSRSIKHLIIHGTRRSSVKKVAIEVPNILFFELSNNFLPTTLSLATTSRREWKSHLNLIDCLDGYENDVLPMMLKLFGLVKELSQSQISLTLFEKLNFKMNQIEWDFNDHPVVVQHLDLNIMSQLRLDTLRHFLNALLRIFRPRYMELKRGINAKEVTKFLWKTLIHDEREKTKYEWEQHLEEVSMEASDENGKVWHHVQWTCLPQWSENLLIRFRMKWRD